MPNGDYYFFIFCLRNMESVKCVTLYSLSASLSNCTHCIMWFLWLKWCFTPFSLISINWHYCSFKNVGVFPSFNFHFCCLQYTWLMFSTWLKHFVRMDSTLLTTTQSSMKLDWKPLYPAYFMLWTNDYLQLITLMSRGQ